LGTNQKHGTLGHASGWHQRKDAAHKAAAAASTTERFILIDGDNIPDAAFFNQTLTFATPEWEQAVFRWRARNHINGLMYGNGGLEFMDT
jgi:hypothetical protein